MIRYNDADHRAEIALLCEHNFSGRKLAHVHPVFTPDGKHVVFSSDAEGALNIYMVEADWSRVIPAR